MTGTDELTVVTFGREICGDLEAGLRREWLVTNGLGRYASGTVAGVATRRYHGLLVAALEPPVRRTVLVAAVVEWATHAGRRAALHAHEYADGTIDRHGYRLVESFALEGSVPRWTYALGEALLEKRVWMARGANATYVSYALSRADEPVELEITPLVTARDHHALRRAGGQAPAVDRLARGVGATIRLDPAAPEIHLEADRGSFQPGATWYRDVRHREEAARGLDAVEDLYAVGTFHLSLAPGEAATLLFCVGPSGPPRLDGAAAAVAVRARDAGLLERAAAVDADPLVRALVLAADAFLVERRVPGEAEPGATVIAGYHWFNDWGRDTMIALPGLTLATGRFPEGARILRSFARFVRDGLLPNNFPDRGRRPARLQHRRRLAVVSAGDRRSRVGDRRPGAGRRRLAGRSRDRGAPPGRHALRDRRDPGRAARRR